MHASTAQPEKQILIMSAPLTSSPNDTLNAPANTPAAPAAPADAQNLDMQSMLQKMAEQQKMIAELTQQVQVKEQDVQKLSEKQRAEMKHLYDTVISKWVDSLDTGNEKAREEFKNGMVRLAETADRENGIWEVVCCASAMSARDRENATKKEEEFQKLQKNYDDLKTQIQGGNFISEDSRVAGNKRPATEQPHVQGGGVDIWSQFSDYMKGSYDRNSFQPPPQLVG